MAVSRRLRFEILRRDNHTCRYCGAMAPDVALTVDHVVPTTLGGSDDPANLVTACDICNGGKSSISPDAPIVADVAADALRWARAIEQARLEYEAERQVVEDQLDRFEASWRDWTYPVEIKVPAEPLDTGVPLLDKWHEAVCYDGHRCAPVDYNEGVLTIHAERGWTREVRSAVNAARTKLAELIGVPELEVVVETVVGVQPPPRPPEPTTRTERHQLPLDPNWRESVTRFLAAGLTVDTLERFVAVAMQNPRLVRTEVFRYFCGCAWREITNLQESARRILESETDVE